MQEGAFTTSNLPSSQREPDPHETHPGKTLAAAATITTATDSALSMVADKLDTGDQVSSTDNVSQLVTDQDAYSLPKFDLRCVSPPSFNSGFVFNGNGTGNQCMDDNHNNTGKTMLSLRGGGHSGGDIGSRAGTMHDVALESDAPRQQDGASSPSNLKKPKMFDTNTGRSMPDSVGSPSIVQLYRERLAREMERRDPRSESTGYSLSNTASTVPQESLSPQSSGNAMRKMSDFDDSLASATDLPTTSTESNRTIRGGVTPGIAARTPSYPFPRMNTPRRAPTTWNKNSARPPRLRDDSMGVPLSETPTWYDQLRSDPSTPASTMNFQPTGLMDPPTADIHFPTPNLYDLTLMLTAEPGLDAWWDAVVRIMTDYFKAERLSLSVPADTTDVENVPWGQKATFDMNEDAMSMKYLGRGSSFLPSSTDGRSERSSIPMHPNNPSNFSNSSNPSRVRRPEGLIRPPTPMRQSVIHEQRKELRKTHSEEQTSHFVKPKRPGPLPRSTSQFTGNENPLLPPHHALNQQALADHDAEEDELKPCDNWEAPLAAGPLGQGRVLPVLQGLDMEADPLIDHNGIRRVLERGKVIALTRTYPYLQTAAEDTTEDHETPTADEWRSKRKSWKVEPSSQKTPARARKSLSADKTKITAIMGARKDASDSRPCTPLYEEHEQHPPSPWSQSPAPSPAIRSEPNENPFFTDSMVDEDSFNPGPSPQDYTDTPAPETIGVDNSWTVLHIPLKHILLSRPTPTFTLDSSVLERKSAGLKKNESTKSESSCYPETTSAPETSNKQSRQSPIAVLSILSPVIPYPSNWRYSLENLSAHLATSFSLCRHYSNLETEVLGLQRKRPSLVGFGAVGPDGHPISKSSLLASMHVSFSDNLVNQQNTSNVTSPSDHSQISRDNVASPGRTPGWDSLGLVVEQRPTGTSPGQMSSDEYFSALSPPANSLTNQPTNRSSGAKLGDKGKKKEKETEDLESSRTLTLAGVHERPCISSTGNSKSSAESDEPGESQESPDGTIDPSLHGSGDIARQHTKLHSYGGDFATSFPSLPAGTPLLSKPTTNTPGIPPTTHVSMLPPSDRLKGLMLDSLPAHVFVALPMTGEIVWVNSRYLIYRGQTVADLIVDPWSCLHPSDRDEYLQHWSKSLRTGEQFARNVRLRRFDGEYRWFQASAVASKDKRGVIVQFIGSFMDIHDQKVAEIQATRQKQIEESEAKHRLLANLIPQIIFTATEEDGITFANDQWLQYTGQVLADTLGVGFLDHVHPEDLAKCRVPTEAHSDFPTSNPSSEDVRTSTTVTPTQVTDAMPKSSRSPRLLGNGRNAGLGRPLTELSELTKGGIVKVTRDATGHLSYTTELRLRSKTGEYRWHLIRCVQIDTIDFGTGASSYFGSATDINDHKLLEAKLKEAMESKGRFLSNMSHEIRTPLIGISGMVSFLQDSPLNEEQRDYTNTIQTSANSLLMIINDILDLSKVDAGMMKLNFEWFHTRSLIEDVNELVSTMAIAKHLELNYVVEPDVPSWVKGDKVRIRQVLLNVIGNAIKFTSRGEVFSRCKVKPNRESSLDANGIMLEFSVVDTGRGFSKEEADLIFKPFSQIDGSSTRQHGGSGLGLVISRQLAELHGGHMDGTAVLGQGSTFTFSAEFSLPTQTDHPETAATPPFIASGKTQPRKSSLPKAANLSAVISPSSDAETSPALNSSASSDPSIRSMRTENTSRSSASSVVTSLNPFSEAAKASGQDLSQMRLEMPTGRISPGDAQTPDPSAIPGDPDQFRPPMYSILVICGPKYSREAITRHIETTLPKDIPHQITALPTVSEAQALIGGAESVTFTHIVLNLSSVDEILEVFNQIMASANGKTTILVLSDSAQRQAVIKLVTDSGHQQLIADKKLSFIYKPVKPSRLAAVFDPSKSRDLSIDRNRFSAAQMVENQKQSYLQVEKRIGNKGYKVLLVEDNKVNQKVLIRYLTKVGLTTQIAEDGVECTDAVFSHPAGYYSLVLCDLHMPRKDGYQTCREIRQWERRNRHRALPIIALSANVMSDVQEKCIEAGFNDYVTKPVDFIDLSTVMSNFFQ